MYATIIIIILCHISLDTKFSVSPRDCKLLLWIAHLKYFGIISRCGTCFTKALVILWIKDTHYCINKNNTTKQHVTFLKQRVLIITWFNVVQTFQIFLTLSEIVTLGRAVRVSNYKDNGYGIDTLADEPATLVLDLAHSQLLVTNLVVVVPQSMIMYVHIA